MTSSEDLAQLLARCALADRRAFERLYRQTSAQLFGLVVRIVKNQDLASEILQEGYVKIWNRAEDFNPDKAKPITWMGAIVRNQAIDVLRRSAHQPAASETVEDLVWLADDAAGPLEIASQEQRENSVYGCFDQLQGPQREAIKLAYFSGLTHEEVAQHMGKPLGTVKSWIRRGLLRLKNCLDESGE